MVKTWRKVGKTRYWKLTKFKKTGESMKSYFPAFLWITLGKIILLKPSIHHSKGLGMRNWQYEISIYQKIIDKATMTISSYFDFC